MKRRSPATPLLLPLATFGIYSLVWFVKTKNELNLTVPRIPTAWLLIVPVAGIVWQWKFAVGIEQYTSNGISRAAAFWLIFLLGGIGTAIIQSYLNAANPAAIAAPVPVAAVAA